MKKLALRILMLILTAGMCSATAQDDSTRKLEGVRKSIETAFSKSLPEWTRRPVTPMEGSRNTIIDHWGSGEWVVKVTVTDHSSQELAAASLKGLRRHLETEEKAAKKRGVKDYKKIKEEMPSLGDEGFTLATYGSTAAAFRKGSLTVSVAVVRPILSEDAVKSRQFAAAIAEILSGN